MLLVCKYHSCITVIQVHPSYLISCDSHNEISLR